MATKTIKKSIVINATPEQAWNALLDHENYKIWAGEFSPGSYADTDWKEGSKVVFTDGSGYGILGRVIKHEPNHIISFEYDSVLEKGEENSTSESSLTIKGAHETYILTQNDDKTLTLDIAADMWEEYYDDMVEAWDRALNKIKELSEAV